MGVLLVGGTDVGLIRDSGSEPGQRSIRRRTAISVTDPREKPLDRPLPLACQPPLFAAASRTYQLAGTPVSRTFNGRLARAAAPPPSSRPERPAQAGLSTSGHRTGAATATARIHQPAGSIAGRIPEQRGAAPAAPLFFVRSRVALRNAAGRSGSRPGG